MKTRRMLALFVLAAASVVPFARCLRYGMINLDDYAYLTNYPLIWRGPALDAVRFFLTTVTDSIWMPLTWLSYALDYVVFGDWYGGFHLHSLVLHAANGVLVFLLLKKIFRGEPEGRPMPLVGLACLAGTLIWAIHPLRCESVVLLSSRKDVLSFFWELLALHFWVDGSAGDRSLVLRRTVLSTVLFAVGAACKPSVMTFPALCLMIDFLVFRRIETRRYVVPFALAVFLAGFSAWQQSVGGATANGGGETLIMRLADCAAAFGIYLKNTVWPADLAVQCIKRWPEMPRFLVAGCCLSVAYLAYLDWRIRPLLRRAEIRFPARDRNYLETVVENGSGCDHVLLGALWFGVAVFPMLGLKPFGFHAFADRFTYIPSVGLSIIAVTALLKLPTTLTPHVQRLVCCTVPLALGVCTWVQTGYWKDDGTLYSHTLEVDGDGNAYAHRSLGIWCFEFPHDLDRCIEEYEKVLATKVGYVDNTIIYYIFALHERGEYGKIRDALDLCTRNNLDAAYKIGKAVWVLDDPDTFDIAEKLLEENDSGVDPIWLYVRLQLARKKGDAKAEADCMAKVRDLYRPMGYFRLTYLRNDVRNSCSKE